jgi:hypothetical protein
MLIRGYNNSGFEAWTIPILYMVGKYLRLFAIKSDAERIRVASSTPETVVMHDDYDPEAEKQGQLRECEQYLKRIFTLCLNDRQDTDSPRYHHAETDDEQGRNSGVQKVGNLLHHQSPVQDVLQAELCLLIANHPQDAGRLQRKGRHASIGIIPEVTASDIQVLRRRAFFSRGELR